MLDPYTIDIDKLHEVTEHVLAGTITSLPRKSGCTTSYLYLMLGEVWFSQPDEQFIYIGLSPQTTYLDFVTLLLYEQIIINQLYSVPYQKIVLANGQTFKFFDKKQANNNVNWIGTSYNKVFFDDDLYSLPRDDRQNLLNNVYFSGAVLV